MLIYILSTLGSGLLLRCVATLRYCVKQLDSWVLGAVKASSIALSEEVILGVDAVKLVCCIRLKRCRSTTGVAAAGVLPEGCWVVGAIKPGVWYLAKRSYWGLILLS